MVGGLNRSFDIFLPDGLGSEAVPLVLLLHGHGGDADTMTGMNGNSAPFRIWLDIAARETLILLIPDGVVGPDGKTGWNDCRADSTTNPTTDDVAFLQSLIQQVQQQYPVDDQRIFASGMSNGGFMSLRLAMEMADQIQAVAPIAAAMPAQSECPPPAEPVSVLFVSGTEDPLVPWYGGEVGGSGSGRGTVLSARDSVIYWVQHNQCPTSPSVSDLPNLDRWDGSTVRLYDLPGGLQNSRVTLYQVLGGGHAEPSRTERYSWLWELVVGRQNHDMEMAEEVWAFFASH